MMPRANVSTKSGKLLGLPYPGGPQMDRLAQDGDAKRFDFPRPKMRDDDDDFSFSGLKTSVRYFLRDHPELAGSAGVRDLCASVQAAIVEVLVTKTMRAAERIGVRCVTASGGVTANRALRQELGQRLRRAGIYVARRRTQSVHGQRGHDRHSCRTEIARWLCEPTSLDADIAPGMALA